MGDISERYSINAQGLPQIKPVRNFPEPEPATIFENISAPHIPFSSNKGVVIRESFPFWDSEDKENRDVAGIIVFELKPDNWSIIFCHTARLNGFEWELDKNQNPTSIGISDYYEIPAISLQNNLQNYVTKIIDICDQMLLKTPDMPAKKAKAMIELMEHLTNCSSKDFTVDIYMPKGTCDLTGEMYLRPGGRDYAAFNNPSQDIEFSPTRAFKQYLRTEREVELPKHGLTSAFDRYTNLIKQYGGGKKLAKSESLPPREAHRLIISAAAPVPTRPAMRPWIAVPIND